MKKSRKNKQNKKTLNWDLDNFNIEEWNEKVNKYLKQCEEKRRQDPEWSVTDDLDMYFPEDYYD